MFEAEVSEVTGLDRFCGKLRLYATAVLEAQSKLQGLLEDLTSSSSSLAVLEDIDSRKMFTPDEDSHLIADPSRISDVIVTSPHLSDGPMETLAFDKVKETKLRYGGLDMEVVSDKVKETKLRCGGLDCGDAVRNTGDKGGRRIDDDNEYEDKGIECEDSVDKDTTDAMDRVIECREDENELNMNRFLTEEDVTLSKEYSMESSVLDSMVKSLTPEPEEDSPCPPSLDIISDFFKYSRELSSSSPSVKLSSLIDSPSPELTLKTETKDSDFIYSQGDTEAIERKKRNKKFNGLFPYSGGGLIQGGNRVGFGRVASPSVGMDESWSSTLLCGSNSTVDGETSILIKPGEMEAESIRAKYLKTSTEYDKLTAILSVRRKSKFLVDAKMENLRRHLLKLKIAFCIEKMKTSELNRRSKESVRPGTTDQRRLKLRQISRSINSMTTDNVSRIDETVYAAQTGGGGGGASTLTMTQRSGGSQQRNDFTNSSAVSGNSESAFETAVDLSTKVRRLSEEEETESTRVERDGNVAGDDGKSSSVSSAGMEREKEIVSVNLSWNKQSRLPSEERNESVSNTNEKTTGQQSFAYEKRPEINTLRNTGISCDDVMSVKSDDSSPGRNLSQVTMLCPGKRSHEEEEERKEPLDSPGNPSPGGGMPRVQRSPERRTKIRRNDFCGLCNRTQNSAAKHESCHQKSTHDNNREIIEQKDIQVSSKSVSSDRKRQRMESNNRFPPPPPPPPPPTHAARTSKSYAEIAIGNDDFGMTSSPTFRFNDVRSPNVKPVQRPFEYSANAATEFRLPHSCVGLPTDYLHDMNRSMPDSCRTDGIVRRRTDFHFPPTAVVPNRDMTLNLNFPSSYVPSSSYLFPTYGCYNDFRDLSHPTYFTKTMTNTGLSLKPAQNKLLEFGLPVLEPLLFPMPSSHDLSHPLSGGGGSGSAFPGSVISHGSGPLGAGEHPTRYRLPFGRLEALNKDMFPFTLNPYEIAER